MREDERERRIDHKSEVIIFMERQDIMNDRLLKSIESIDKSLSKSDAMQVELNEISKRTTKLESTIELVNDKIVTNERNTSKEMAGIREQMVVNTSIIEQQKDMKKLLMGGLITLGVAFIITISATVFMSGNNNDDEYKKAVIELLKIKK